VSIVTLKKMTVAGCVEARDQILTDLQELGCLHLLDLASTGERGEQSSTRSESREALKYLLNCPNKRRPVTDASKFDPLDVERQALEVQQRVQELTSEHDLLVERLRDLEPWGEFRFASLEEMGGYRLWFYAVPHYQIDEVKQSELSWHIVNQDNRLIYVVVISEREPEGMPVPRMHLGTMPRSDVAARLEEVELAIADAEAERASLTRWGLLLAKCLAHLEDAETRANAKQHTLANEDVFALSAWLPADKLPQVEAYAREHSLVLEARDPEPDETPPTLFDNRPLAASGEDLVSFYMTPSYWTWDPSGVVLFSFAVFFAMIVSDAGYGLLFVLGVLGLWKRLGKSIGGSRIRNTLAAVSVATLVYGVLVASYFGMTPPAGSWLFRLRVLEMQDSQTMMLISVIIGVAHVAFANVMNAVRFGWQGKALAPLGWALMIIGAFFTALGNGLEMATMLDVGLGLLGGGALLVFLFSGAGSKPLKRMVQGLFAFTRVSKAFGDILSYLRLFALGLASASLAMAFNDMAGQIKEAVPGVGLLFALVVLLLGHTINVVLAIASGVIHGLRLNVIEFFDWGVPDEGRLYKPFKRKETVPWNP